MFSELLKKVQVQDVMVRKVITVKESDDFALVWEKMSLNDIRHLPVIDRTNALVGLVTQRDLYKIHSPRLLEDGTWFYDKEVLNTFILSKMMINDVLTVTPETNMFDVVKIFVERKVGCVVVIDVKRQLLGILTRVDALKMLLI